MKEAAAKSKETILKKRKEVILSNSNELKKFTYNDRMLDEVKGVKHHIPGTVPFPKSLEKTDFSMICWNAWYNLVKFLKKRLRDQAPDRSMEALLGKGRKIVFSLTHQDGKFIFKILHPTAARLLNLPRQMEFNHPCPFEMYTEIVHKVKKKK